MKATLDLPLQITAVPVKMPLRCRAFGHRWATAWTNFRQNKPGHKPVSFGGLVGLACRRCGTRAQFPPQVRAFGKGAK